MQLVAKDADTLSDGSSTAATSWISMELLTKLHRMNPTYVSGNENTGSIGGWEKSELRAYLASTIKPLLPENIQSKIKAVQKTCITMDAALQKSEATVSDELWIPSAREICLDINRIKTEQEKNGPRYGSVFSSYDAVVKYYGGHGNFYYLRTVYDEKCYYSGSPSIDHNNAYIEVNPTQMGSDYWPRIALGFCI